MNASFQVTIQDFEGPLDLLLYLIETRKMAIADVKLALITDQYLNYLRDSLAQQMEVASDFIVLASTLIAIKARSLLPPSKAAEASFDVDAAEEDLEALLRERLLTYSAYKELAQELKRREQSRQEQAGRMPMALDAYRKKQTVGDFLAGLTLDKLVGMYESVQKRLLDDPDIEVYRDHESIPMRMVRIERRLALGPTTFMHLLESRSRREWVAVFLSVLELIHLRKVVFRQEGVFADIWIEKV